MPTIHHRPLASLPSTRLPWLSLRDHFIATVGASAGRGRPLGSMLVLADATFAPHSRFPLHPHEEMEILSIVLDGRLSHHGDQAHGATIGARSAQLISARNGMVHAEGNDTDAPTRMLQIWFRPDTHGGPPAYFSRDFPSRGRQLIAGDDSMPLRCDARVWWLDLEPTKRERVIVPGGNRGYLLALDGPVNAVDGEQHRPLAMLATGEGLQVDDGGFDVTAPAACSALWIEVGASRS
ncbi:pirin family protein [Myxococcaceae bacterium GXIMD 01537]